MKRNLGSQLIAAQLVSATDGSNVTSGTTTVTVELDGVAGTGGTATHIANGKWEYAPIAGDTDAAHITFQFTNTSAVSVLLNVYPSFPQTVDNDTKLTTIAADVVNVDGYNLATQIGTAGAGLTNIGTIATVTTLTNLPTIPANWITAAGIANAAIDAATFAAGAIDSTAVGLLDNTNFTHVDPSERVDVGAWLGAAATSGTGGPDVNINAIGDSTAAAVNLSASALGIVPGATEGTPSTTVIQTDLAEATDDHYIGRIIVFTSGVAAGQASDITDYTGATGTVTVTALTTAPAAADNFVIV